MTRLHKTSIRKLAALSSAAVGLALGASLMSSPAKAGDLCNNFNTQGVTNPPMGQTYCLLPAPAGQTATYHVSQLVTYHYNGGRGAAPGTISLRGTNGRMYSFAAHDDYGRRGYPSYNWIADVNVDLPADNYAVIDSDWNSWSTNAMSRGWGFAIVRGALASVTSPPPPPPARPVVTSGFIPLPNGQFCTRDTYAIADIYACTGPTRSGTMTITMRQKRQTSYPATGPVSYQVLYNAGGPPVQGAAPIFGGIALSKGSGTAVNSEYTLSVPAALCLYPNRYFRVSVGGYNTVGQFFPDCR